MQTSRLLSAARRRAPLILALVCATLVALVATEAIVRGNVEREWEGQLRTSDHGTASAATYTLRMRPGDSLHLPTMFPTGAPHAGRIDFFLLRAADAAAAAEGHDVQALARRGPDYPGLPIDFRAPEAMDVALVWRVQLATLTSYETHRARTMLATQYPFVAFDDGLTGDRMTVTSGTAVAAADAIRVAEALGGTLLLPIAVAAFFARPRREAAQSPAMGQLERLARAGANAAQYLRTIRALTILAGLLTLASLYFGLITLVYTLEALPSGARPGPAWFETTVVGIGLIGLVLVALWLSQVHRIQRELRRLDRLPPPSA